MTQITLIKRALRLLGVLAPGEDLPDSERQDAAQALQAMLGDWATQNLTMYATVMNELTLQANVESYTVGSGGDLDIERPTFIQEVGLINNEDPTQPVEYPIEHTSNAQRWQEVRLKSLTGGWPELIYYQRTFPLARLWPYPIPDVSTLALKLYSRQRVTGFTSPSTEYTLPDGYEDAITFNLSKRLAPEFGVQVPPNVDQLARETFTNIKRVNMQTPELRIQHEIFGSTSPSGAYDWRSDQ